MASHFSDRNTSGQQRPAARRQGTQRQASGYDYEPYTPAPYDIGEVKPRRSNRRRRRKRRALVAVVVVLIAALACAGAALYLNPPFYNVTVNGVEQRVDAGTTVQQLIDEGYATPTAGNLIAVDGSVAQAGGGTAFTATVNGAEAAGDTAVTRNATVTIDNGADVEEEYTETVEAIPHGESGYDTSSPSTYYYGSIHIYSQGEDGEKSVRTGNVSGITIETVTKEPIDAGYHAYTANTGDDKVIALTFDDGPWSGTTEQILDILKENGAHATFFQIGNQIADLADVEKRIYNEGHQLATHTWDHAAGSGQGVNITFMTSDEQLNEIEKGFAAIEDTLGVSVSRIMRAPGGNYYGSVISTLQGVVTAEIGWDVDTEDWSRPGVDAIVQAILSAKSGNVVLMHDGGGDRSQTVEALRQALPQLVAQGYKFVTVDELLAYGM